MTAYILDIASYQAGLNLAVCKAANWSAVNIKTSQGTSYIFGDARSWADKARALGMGISTFHWLDGSGSGAAQANIAYQRMKDLGGPAGMAHQCDCEDNGVTWAIVRDYVNAMQQKLGRHVVLYTGDWWWMDSARGGGPSGWNGASLTPYVWAAPNHGYDSSYPGDQSSEWRAGYGGWGDYSVLQYAVGTIAGAGGADISKSAIRDPAVWSALTGSTAGGADVNLSDPVPGTKTPEYAQDRTVGIALMDLWMDVHTRLVPDLRGLAKVVAELQARPAGGGLTDEQATAMAGVVAAALVDRTDNPLGPADRPAIVQAVKQALAEIVASSTAANPPA